MKVFLYLDTKEGTIHASENQKLTGCRINLQKGDNVSRYNVAGATEDEMGLLDVSCVKCQTVYLKKMMKADKKERARKVKEERRRKKAGLDIEDEGMVNLAEEQERRKQEEEEARRMEEMRIAAAEEEAARIREAEAKVAAEAERRAEEAKKRADAAMTEEGRRAAQSGAVPVMAMPNRPKPAAPAAPQKNEFASEFEEPDFGEFTPPQAQQPKVMSMAKPKPAAEDDFSKYVLPSNGENPTEAAFEADAKKPERKPRSIANFFGTNESDIMAEFGMGAPKKEEAKPAEKKSSMMKPTSPAPAPKMGSKFLTSVEDIMAGFGFKQKKQKETIDDLVAEFGNSTPQATPAPAPPIPAVEPFNSSSSGSAMNELMQEFAAKPEQKPQSALTSGMDDLMAEFNVPTLGAAPKKPAPEPAPQQQPQNNGLISGMDDLMAEFSVPTLNAPSKKPEPAPQQSALMNGMDDLMSEFSVPTLSAPSKKSEPTPEQKTQSVLTNGMDDLMSEFSVPTLNAASQKPEPAPEQKTQSALTSGMDDLMAEFSVPTLSAPSKKLEPIPDEKPVVKESPAKDADDFMSQFGVPSLSIPTPRKKDTETKEEDFTGMMAAFGLETPKPKKETPKQEEFSLGDVDLDADKAEEKSPEFPELSDISGDSDAMDEMMSRSSGKKQPVQKSVPDFPDVPDVSDGMDEMMSRFGAAETPAPKTPSQSQRSVFGSSRSVPRQEQPQPQPQQGEETDLMAQFSTAEAPTPQSMSRSRSQQGSMFGGASRSVSRQEQPKPQPQQEEETDLMAQFSTAEAPIPQSMSQSRRQGSMFGGASRSVSKPAQQEQSQSTSRSQSGGMFGNAQSRSQSQSRTQGGMFSGASRSVSRPVQEQPQPQEEIDLMEQFKTAEAPIPRAASQQHSMSGGMFRNAQSRTVPQRRPQEQQPDGQNREMMAQYGTTEAPAPRTTAPAGSMFRNAHSRPVATRKPPVQQENAQAQQPENVQMAQQTPQQMGGMLHAQSPYIQPVAQPAGSQQSRYAQSYTRTQYSQPVYGQPPYGQPMYPPYGQPPQYAPQFMGYDANGQPVYAAPQPYGQPMYPYGQPYVPPYGQPYGQPPMMQNGVPAQQPEQPKKKEREVFKPSGIHVSVIDQERDVTKTSAAFRSAISKAASELDENEHIFDQQDTSGVVVDDVTAALASMGADTSAFQSKKENTSTAQIQYEAYDPTKKRRSSGFRRKEKKEEQLSEEERKKREKIDAEFQKKLAKRGF